MALPKKAERIEGSEDQSVIVKDCTIWSGRGLRKGSILIENGKIRKIATHVPARESRQIDARGLLAIPGLIDAHVHLRDMELSYKEDFTSGTAAAAAGGFTSILDMPNTKPPVVSEERLKERMGVASRKILVNVGFHAAAVKDSSVAGRMARVGAFSFKLYLPQPISPVEIDNDDELLAILETAGKSKTPVTVHAEEPSMISDPSVARSYLDLARARPSRAESHSVRRILKLQRLANCSIHFTHITLPSSIHRIRQHRSAKVTSEVTLHHLLLSELQLEKLGWRAWMIPPLRKRGVNRKLFSAASRGEATIVASDHAPHSISEKKRFPDSPPGVPGLETTLPLLLTLVSQGKLSMKRMVSMLASKPAGLFGMRSKGRLEEGADGDVVLVDLKKKSRVTPENFFSKAKYSPFEGFETRGGVEKTIVGGRLIFDNGRIVGSPGTGRVLRRDR